MRPTADLTAQASLLRNWLLPAALLLLLLLLLALLTAFS
jgi:hypothetical protein